MPDVEDQERGGAQREFLEQAERGSGGLLRDYLDFLRQGKKWYLTPIILFLLLIGLIGVLGSTVVAPFIYTLF